MAWVYLFVAGIFETVWVVAMKYADGVHEIGSQRDRRRRYGAQRLAVGRRGQNVAAGDGIRGLDGDRGGRRRRVRHSVFRRTRHVRAAGVRRADYRRSGRSENGFGGLTGIR